MFGLPIWDNEIQSLYNTFSTKELGVEFSTSGLGHSTFMLINMKNNGLVIDGEHHAFLLF